MEFKEFVWYKISGTDKLTTDRYMQIGNDLVMQSFRIFDESLTVCNILLQNKKLQDVIDAGQKLEQSK